MTQQMSSKTLLSQFGQRPTRRVSFLDEFMRVGDRAYGKLNTGVSKLSSYGSPGYSRQSPLDTVEYFGKISASKGANVDVEKFKETIRKAEGLKLEPYKDKDKFSIGYGHLLVDGPTGNISVDRIDKKDAETLLEKDVQVRLKEVNRLLPDFKNFPEDAQQAIFSEYYRGSIGQSPVTRALINAGRYKEAAKEFLNNKEYINADKNKQGGIKKRMEAVSEALINMSEKKFLNDTIVPERKPFRYGGQSRRGGLRGGRRGGPGSGGNKGGNKRGKGQGGSLRDSGMVQGSSGYGPAGAGGQALGPSGNQGGNQGGNQTTTTTAEPPTFGPTYETPEYTPYKPKTIVDSLLDTYDDFTTFDTPLGEAKINLGLDSAGVSLSFKRGGLLDRSSKK